MMSISDSLQYRQGITVFSAVDEFRQSRIYYRPFAEGAAHSRMGCIHRTIPSVGEWILRQYSLLQLLLIVFRISCELEAVIDAWHKDRNNKSFNQFVMRMLTPDAKGFIKVLCK